MNKLWYPAVATLLLCSGQAIAGNDFCDNARESELNTDGIQTGGCEVNLTLGGSPLGDSGLTSTAAPSGAPLPRMREIPFNPSFYQQLQATRDNVNINFTICSAVFGNYIVPEVMETALVEWTFESDDKSDDGRALILSLRREDEALMLHMDWQIPPGRGWSVANQSGIEPILLDTRKFQLGRMYRDRLQFDGMPRLYLKRDGRAVSVGLREEGKLKVLARFELPEGDWAPIRLRNGFLHNTLLHDGMRVHVAWPREFLSVDVPTGPGAAPIDPPESPDPVARE